MTQTPIEVRTSNGESYPVHVGKGILDEAGKFIRERAVSRVAIVVDDVVADLHLRRLLDSVGAIPGIEVVTVPSGETSKSLDEYSRIMGVLLGKNFRRDSLVVAFGGGMVGDLTGFVAATLLRGVALCHIPTTLLAQVDSAIGGKTGINHLMGKNLVGTIHQPLSVFCDLDVLGTLPEREYLSGLAEVVKYGLAFDHDFFGWVRENGAQLAQREEAVVQEAVRRSIARKADVVSKDVFEQGETRVLLNLGHTFGHAIENALDYRRLLHGEAVSIGLVTAADLSVRVSGFSEADSRSVKSLLESLGLPTVFPYAVKNKLMASMAVDKKFDASGRRFVLLRGIGDAYVERNVDGKTLNEAIDAVGFTA